MIHLKNGNEKYELIILQYFLEICTHFGPHIQQSQQSQLKLPLPSPFKHAQLITLTRFVY